MVGAGEVFVGMTMVALEDTIPAVIGTVLSVCSRSSRDDGLHTLPAAHLQNIINVFLVQIRNQRLEKIGWFSQVHVARARYKWCIAAETGQSPVTRGCSHQQHSASKPK